MRQPEHDVDPLFPRRWSPRAMSGEALSEAELLKLFEAARWAPSSNNNQPWRFLYAPRGSAHWDLFFSLLLPGNQAWCKNAGALIVVVSKNTFDHNGSPSRTHSFDTGAAWMSLALQASLAGLVAHGMQGFDYDRARAELHVPDDHTVEAMIAVGHPGRREDLPEKYQAIEQPNSRRPLHEIMIAGPFAPAAQK